MHPDIELIEYITKSLVESPEDISTKRTIDEKGVLIELSVNQADLGKIIGREGSTVQAIRSLLKVLGSKNNARYNLKIIEPQPHAVYYGSVDFAI